MPLCLRLCAVILRLISDYAGIWNGNCAMGYDTCYKPFTGSLNLALAFAATAMVSHALPHSRRAARPAPSTPPPHSTCNCHRRTPLASARKPPSFLARRQPYGPTSCDVLTPSLTGGRTTTTPSPSPPPPPSQFATTATLTAPASLAARGPAAPRRPHPPPPPPAPPHGTRGRAAPPPPAPSG